MTAVTGGVRYIRLTTLVTASRRIKSASKEMAPMDKTSTSQPSANSSAGDHFTSRVSNISAKGASAMPAATNWMTEPARRSKLPQKRFWYMVPIVMPASASSAKPALTGVTPDRLVFCITTSAIPARPSNKPAHCRGDTRSPNKGAATKAVRTGCKPTIRAISPAEIPW